MVIYKIEVGRETTVEKKLTISQTVAVPKKIPKMMKPQSTIFKNEESK